MSQLDDDVLEPDDLDDLPTRSMQYLQAYQFITENPDWAKNLLLVTVCQFIPFVGFMAILGYQFELAEFLIRSRSRHYLEFNFDRFPDYLWRGFLVFLVGLLAGLVLMVPLIVVIGVCFVASAFGMQALDPEGASPLFMFIIGPIAFLACMIAWLAVMALQSTMTLHVGLSQDFGKAFDFQFVMNFTKIMWKEMLLGQLFLMVSFFPLMIVGLMFCFVGVYFAISIFFMAQTHLMFYQLYAVYVSRGGEPIAWKAQSDF